MDSTGKRGFAERMYSLRGMFYGLIAGLCSSASGAFVKLTHDIHSIEILIFRDIIQASVCLLICLVNGYSLRGEPGERKYILSRCIFGTISLTCWFVSVKYTNFGDAAAIYYSYPVFIVFLARIMLKEPLDYLDIVIVVFAVVGIFSISGPHYLVAIFDRASVDFSHNDIIGVSLASVACIAISCGNCSIRKLSRTPAAVVVVWFSLFSMVCALILVPIVDRYRLPASPLEWLYVVMVGVFGVLTQIFVTLAFQLEHAAPISVMESFNVAFSFVIQYYVFNERIKVSSIIGAVILFSSVFAIGVKKLYSQKVYASQLTPVNGNQSANESLDTSAINTVSDALQRVSSK